MYGAGARSRTGLLDRKVEASLKVVGLEVRLGDHDRLLDRKVEASLKGPVDLERADLRRGLLDRKVEASLKGAGRNAWSQRSGARTPRPKGRGLIEGRQPYP